MNVNCVSLYCILLAKKKKRKMKFPALKYHSELTNHKRSLQELLQELFVASFYPPDKMEEYGIASFGVSVTTLEEVFMKVGEGAEKTVDDL